MARTKTVFRVLANLEGSLTTERIGNWMLHVEVMVGIVVIVGAVVGVIVVVGAVVVAIVVVVGVVVAVVGDIVGVSDH